MANPYHTGSSRNKRQGTAKLRLPFGHGDLAHLPGSEDATSGDGPDVALVMRRSFFHSLNSIQGLCEWSRHARSGQREDGETHGRVWAASQRREAYHAHPATYPIQIQPQTNRTCQAVRRRAPPLWRALHSSRRRPHAASLNFAIQDPRRHLHRRRTTLPAILTASHWLASHELREATTLDRYRQHETKNRRVTKNLAHGNQCRANLRCAQQVTRANIFMRNIQGITHKCGVCSMWMHEPIEAVDGVFAIRQRHLKPLTSVRCRCNHGR